MPQGQYSLSEAKPIGQYTPAPASPPPEAPRTGMAAFLQEADQGLTPEAMGRALEQTVTHPIATAQGVLAAHGKVGQEALDAYHRGDYTTAATKGLDFLLPIIGPRLSQADDYLRQGEVARGLGAFANVLGQLAAAKGGEAAAPEVAAAKASVAAAAERAGQAARAGLAAAKEVGPVGDLAVDVLGMASPRLAHGARVAQRVGRVAQQIKDAVAERAAAPEAAPAAAPPSLPVDAAPPAPAPATAPAPALTPLSEVVAPRAAAPGALLTAEQRAAYAQQGYSPAHIASIEQALQRRAARATATPPVASAPPAPAPPAAAPAAPAASTPAAPAPRADLAPPADAPTTPATTAPTSAILWTDQRVKNAVGLAMRRAKLTLTDAQLEQADRLVAQGKSPESAVRMVAPAPKLKLTAAEQGVAQTLRQRGVSDAEILQRIQAQRDLAARLGTPASEAVRQAIQERNLTGRWPDAPE